MLARHRPLHTALLSLASTGLGYELIHDYSGNSFFGGWDYYGNWDNLTLGNVTYLTQEAAMEQMLTYINDAGNAIIQVDNFSTVADGERRNSIRITSQEYYDYGTLWVIDALHLPYGCSVWPAFWSTAPNWPYGGEIDIIEGIENQVNNQFALHTTNGCVHDDPTDQLGSNIDTDCSAASGCTVEVTAQNNYQSGFAAAGGGVYATLFEASGIYMWFWSRPDIPASLTDSGSAVDTSSWGAPTASYPTGAACNVTQFFKPQQLIFDITLCGVWAGVPSIYDGQCYNAGPHHDCYLDNVVGDGNNYDEAYFEVSYVRTYATGTALAEAQSATVSATPSATSSASLSIAHPSTTQTHTEDARRTTRVDLAGVLISFSSGLLAGAVL